MKKENLIVTVRYESDHGHYHAATGRKTAVRQTAEDAAQVCAALHFDVTPDRISLGKAKFSADYHGLRYYHARVIPSWLPWAQATVVVSATSMLVYAALRALGWLLKGGAP